MRLRKLPVASVVLALSACAVPYNADQPKIAELQKEAAERGATPGLIDEPEPAPLEGEHLDKAIENYRKILELSPDDPQVRAEAQRRLADLQIEVSELDPSAEEQGKVSTETSVRLYEQLLRENPGASNNDRILYQKARAHQNRGEVDQAISALSQLTREHPDSRLAGDSEFRRAELLFSRKRYAEAETGYGKVMDRGIDTSFFERAQYKFAWSIFKQERYADALETFIAILDRELPVGAVDNLEATLDVVPRAQRELVRDVLRVVSLSFSYLGGGQAVTEFLRGRVERTYEPVLYANLSQLFIDKNRYSDAARSLSALADRSPTHRLAPLFQAQIIDVYDQAGFPDQVLQAKVDYVEKYDLDQPYWTAHDRSDSPQAYELLRANMEELARHWHAGAQDPQTPAASRAPLFERAASGYARYLQRFADAENRPKINFLYAESLFELGRFAAAAEQYERTAYGYGKHEQAPEAGYAAVLSRHRLQGDPAGEPNREAIEASVATSQRYASNFPDQPQVAAVLTRAAEDLYRIGELQRTIEMASRLVTRKPLAAPDLRLTAWSLIGYANMDQNKFRAAEAGFREALGLTTTQTPEHAELAHILASTIYKQGERAQADGNTEAAVGHFLRIKEAAPGTAIAASGDFDAAAALISVQAWDRAAKVLQGFRSTYPAHELQAEVTRKLAGVYLESNQPVLAAAEFGRIAASAAEPQAVRQEASWRSATLYEEAGQVDQAMAVYARHVRAFPRPYAQAFVAYDKLISYTDQRNDRAQNRVWRQELMRADQAAGSESTERSRYLAAESSMLLATDARRAFEAARLTMPLKRSLPAKKLALEQALNAYRRAANYAIADFATEATFRIAELYYQLSKDLLGSDRPRGLSELELEQYELLLEEQAFPLEEQAIDIHTVNTGRVGEGIYDDWVRASFTQLAKINPGRYDKAERSEEAVETLR